MDNFDKLLSKTKLPHVKTIVGVVKFTIKLVKKTRKLETNRDVIKQCVTLVLEKYVKEDSLPTGINLIINSITEEEMFDLIDDLYETKDCLKILKGLSCKSKTTTKTRNVVTTV